MRTELEVRVCTPDPEPTLPARSRTAQQSLARRLAGLDGRRGLEVSQRRSGAHVYWHVDIGDGLENAAYWVSGRYIVDVSPPGLQEVPPEILALYLAAYPSDVDEELEARLATGPGPRINRSTPPPWSFVPPRGWIQEAPAFDAFIRSRRLDRLGESIENGRHCLYAAAHVENACLQERFRDAAHEQGCEREVLGLEIATCPGYEAFLYPHIQEATSSGEVYDLRFVEVCTDAPELSTETWLSTVELAREADWLIEAVGPPRYVSLELGLGRNVTLELGFGELPPDVEARVQEWIVACREGRDCAPGARRAMRRQPGSRTVSIVRVRARGR